jgi:hypothetical protein
MAIGILWRDETTQDLRVLITRSAAYYRKHYGSSPDVVFVHPSQMPAFCRLDGMDIRTSPNLQPGLLWVGLQNPAAAT